MTTEAAVGPEPSLLKNCLEVGTSDGQQSTTINLPPLPHNPHPPSPLVVEVEPAVNDTGSSEQGNNCNETDDTEANQNNVVMEVEEEQQCFYVWDYQLTTAHPLPCLAKSLADEFKNGCLKGCKWAPDGSCLLTNSEDKVLRLYNLPIELDGVTNWSEFDKHQDEEWHPVVKVKEGGQVYDYCWFPSMSSMVPETACFLTSAQDNPVHLWDAFTGLLRATYMACNYADVVIAAHSIAFDAYGEKIYCGYQNGIRIFDINRPGRQCIERQHKGSVLPDLNLTGIISCIAVSPFGNSCYACGSFDKGIGIYLEDGTPVTMLRGHNGGLTQLKFNRDGTKLFSGGRKDSRLICWDMRNLGTEYQIYDRVVETSQRVYFDLSPNEKYLVTGCTNGEIRVWDLQGQSEMKTLPLGNGLTPQYTFPGSTDCVNGTSLNPYLPLMAVATGQRHFTELAKDDEEEIFVEAQSKAQEEIGIRLFKFM